MYTLAKVGMIMLVTTTCDSNTLVLALATLGGSTKNRKNTICVVLSKVAKASTVVTVLYVAFAGDFASKCCQCTRAFKMIVMDHLHCSNLLTIMPTIATSVFTCLCCLGRYDHHIQHNVAG
jgi:hypothetical protein